MKIYLKMTNVVQVINAILVCVLGILMVYLAIRYLRHRNKFSHCTQLFLLISTVITLTLSLYLALGRTAIDSVLTGLTVAIGLALQPFIKTIIPGFIFDGTKIPQGEHTIQVKNIRGTVKQVGLLHTWIADEDGNLIMVSNSIFETEPVKVMNILHKSQ